MYFFKFYIDIKLYCSFLELIFKIIITELLLGGPIFCERESPVSYTFLQFAQETVSITVCGVPAPIVRWEFITGIFQNASREKVNSYTFIYSMPLPVLTQDKCGKELTFIAKGYLGKEEERKSRIFLSNCKFTDLLVFIVLVPYFFEK